MNKRPRSVTLISVIVITAGAVAFVAGLLSAWNSASAQRAVGFNAQRALEHAPVLAIRALAVLCGVLMLFGFNWARCILVVWTGGHVLIGFLHAPWSGMVHGALFGLIVYLLFRPRASAYFRGPKAEPPQIPRTGDPPGI